MTVFTHCRQCGKRKKPPKGRYAPLAHYETDQFCSTACCKAYYGITQAGDTVVYGSVGYRKPVSA